MQQITYIAVIRTTLKTFTMKAIKILFIPIFLLIASTLFFSCDDEDDSISLAPLIEHKGIYMDSFLYNGTLGNAAKEDALLAWCDEHDFTEIYLYNIGAILGGAGTGANLSAFVDKAHNIVPRINVSFVSAGFGTSFTSIENYHDNHYTKPDGIVSEIEFWNGDKTFPLDYEPWLDKVDSLKFGVTPRNSTIKKQFYIGKIKNSGETPSLTIAKELVKRHDEIFLTNYHSNGYDLSASESENSIKNKLRLLGQAGMELDKKVNIVILFSVFRESPSPHIFDYFDVTAGDNSFENAYVNWYDDFEDATDIDNKDYLNVKGYGIYRHTDARVARP